MRVLGKCGHEGQMDVHVRVDEPGENELSFCVDNLGIRRRCEVEPDRADHVVLNQNVRVVPRLRGHNLSAFDQQCHPVTLTSTH